MDQSIYTSLSHTHYWYQMGMLKVTACKVSNLQNRSSPGSLINAVVSSYYKGQGKKMSKRLGGIIGCKDKTSSWHLIGFPDGSNIGSTLHHVGEKPTVILYTYINRHAGTPSKPKPKDTMSLVRANVFHWVWDRMGV